MSFLTETQIGGENWTSQMNTFNPFIRPIYGLTKTEFTLTYKTFEGIFTTVGFNHGDLLAIMEEDSSGNMSYNTVEVTGGTDKKLTGKITCLEEGEMKTKQVTIDYSDIRMVFIFQNYMIGSEIELGIVDKTPILLFGDKVRVTLRDDRSFVAYYQMRNDFEYRFFFSPYMATVHNITDIRHVRLVEDKFEQES